MKVILEQEMVELLSDCVYETSTEGSFLYANCSFLSLVGYSKEEILHLSLQNIMDDDSVKEANHLRLHYQTNLSETQTRMSFDSTFIHKDGHKIRVHQEVTYRYNEKGNMESMIGVAHIISPRCENKYQLRSILDSASEGIFRIDVNGECNFVNTSCLRLLGYDKQEELLGKNIYELAYAPRLNGTIKHYQESAFYQAMIHGKQLHLENEILWRKDGSYFYGQIHLHPQVKAGKIEGLVITFFDDTERKAIEDQLRESERTKSVLVSNLPGLVYRCKFDQDWTMLFVSKGCLELTGYYPDSLLHNRDLSFSDLILPEYQDYLWEKWSRVIPAHQFFRAEYQITTKQGNLKWVYEQGQGIYNERGEVEAIEGFIFDITEQKNKQEIIRHISYHDGLTGVYNRIFFEQEKKRLDQKEYLPLSIIMGDINGLRLVNDAFGHEAGDELIIKTSKIIQGCLQPNAILSRIGGDEFAILLPNQTEEETYETLKKIQSSYEEYNLHNLKNPLNVNISLGFATKQQMDQDLAQMQKTAEEYMNKRKLLERTSTHSSLINSIMQTMYENSQETESHAERLQKLSRLVGLQLDLGQGEMDELALLAALHDIGKIGVSDDILNKPDRLTDEEWAKMRCHPEIGYRIAMSAPELSTIAKYILAHHERWDGKGYPQGLKGYEIPLLARIIAIVDAYDAMTNDRIYRKAISKAEALSEIARNVGTQFDPDIAKIFISLQNKYR